jgi:hypothetical protein
MALTGEKSARPKSGKKSGPYMVFSTGTIFRRIKASPAISNFFCIPENGPNRQKSTMP